MARCATWLDVAAALVLALALVGGCGGSSADINGYGCFEAWPGCAFDWQCPRVAGQPKARVVCRGGQCTPDPPPMCGAGCLVDSDCGAGRACLRQGVGVCVDAPPDMTAPRDLSRR